MLTAIIVAAGSSQRMGFDKLFAPLHGKAVIAHTIAAFEGAESVAEIILVARADRLGEFDAMKIGKVSKVIAGGARRQDSVAAGLRELKADAQFVAVHDAARPLVRPEEIEQLFEACRREGAAVLADPVSDTIKRATDDGFIAESIERERLFALQTPQIFARAVLERAYALVAEKGITVTDETSAVMELGEKIAIVRNDEANFKITYPADLAMAEFVLKRRSG